MRGTPLVLAAACAASAAGCEEHVRECGGGVEVVIAVADVDALANAADTMRVTLAVGGVQYQRGFPTASLGGGETWFTVDLDNTEPVTLGVLVDIAYDGPGYYSGDVLWLRGESGVEVPAGGHGCLPMRVELAAALDSDGDRVPDIVDSCDALANPLQEDADRDDVGDACDGCPMAANTTQADGDGDGDQDACDPCPAIADQSMTDEDGDAIPNVCDPCPHLFGDRDDGDGDGVGDACDPRPTLDGDRIAAFFDFSDASQAAQLTKLGPGTMTIDGGQLSLSSAGSTAVIVSRTLGVSGVVVTRVHQAPNTTMYPWGAGTIAWVDPQQTPQSDEPAGVVCLSHNMIAFADLWPTILPPVLPTQHDPDVVARWSFVDEGSVNPMTALGLCTTDAATDTYDRQWSAETIQTGFGVFAYDAVARFDYLLLIDSP